MLRVKNLHTGYGNNQVVSDVDLHVGRGEIVALIGPNGAGKSTVLKAVHGLVPVWQGEIEFCGENLNGMHVAKRVTRGMTFLPQGRRVFNECTVKENLEIGGIGSTKRDVAMRMDAIYDLFPFLPSKLSQSAGSLSGGEQQMVALARALIQRPTLLMLDEPTLGLAPNLAKEVFKKITEIMQETGISIVIVEHRVREVLEISQRVYSLRLGKVAYAGNSNVLNHDSDGLRQLFL